MNMTGKWANKSRIGEGIDIGDYADGQVIAHFYSSTAAGQFWLIGVGKHGTGQTVLEAFKTIGAINSIVETPAGRIVLEETAKGIKVALNMTGAPALVSEMERLYVVGATPVPIPPPASDTTIEIAWFNKLLDPQWRVQPTPFESTRQSTLSRMANTTWIELRVKVLTGQLSVINTHCEGEHNPSITQFARGRVYKAGEEFFVDCKVGTPTVTTPTLLHYGVGTKELGDIIRLGLGLG